MDELDLFRGFRRGVAGPSGDAQRRASALLATATEGEHARGPSVLRLIRKRPGRTALALATVAGAAAVALALGTPFSNSPGFLERAQAALTPPSGMILHQKWEMTLTSTELACTVTHDPKEIWIDETPPYRYRALLTGLPPADLPVNPTSDDLRALCSSGTASELGGALDDTQPLMFVPPNTLRTSPLMLLFPLDPVQELREAISGGWAHDEGETQLAGRTVERIHIDDVCEPSYAYVDPKTFYPVQLESFMPTPSNIWPALREQPLCSVGFHIVMRTLTFEYLPRTAANLELTDIRAQHPDATGVGGP